MDKGVFRVLSSKFRILKYLQHNKFFFGNQNFRVGTYLGSVYWYKHNII